MNVDVIIPCGGSGTYIEPTLCSLLGQTKRPGSIYVMDNACTHTAYQDVAKKYEQAGVTYIRFPKRLQMTENWQRCMNTGTAPFFLMLSDDDVLLEDALETIHLGVMSDKNTSCVLLPHADFGDDPDHFSRGIAVCQETFRTLSRLPDKQRQFLVATSNVGHMSGMGCRRMPLSFPQESKWNFDQAFLFNHLAYGQVVLASSSGAGIRRHATQGTARFGVNTRMSIEAVAHLRRCLLFFLENRGLTPADFEVILSLAGQGYLFRIVHGCFSWPLRKRLVEFGRGLLAIPEVRKQVVHYNVWLGRLPWPCWLAATLGVDLRYYTQEEPITL